MIGILLGFAFIHEDKIPSLENMSVELVKSLEFTQKIFEPKTKNKSDYNLRDYIGVYGAGI